MVQLRKLYKCLLHTIKQFVGAHKMQIQNVILTVKGCPVTGPGQAGGGECLQVQVPGQLQHRDVPVTVPIVPDIYEILVSHDVSHRQRLLSQTGFPRYCQVIISDSNLNNLKVFRNSRQNSQMHQPTNLPLCYPRHILTGDWRDLVQIKKLLLNRKFISCRP